MKLELPASGADVDGFGALLAVGDGLRLGLRLPARVQRWLSEVELVRLRGFVAALAERAETCRARLSTSGAEGVLLLCRDQLDSARVALVCVLLGRGLFPGETAVIEPFERALAGFDAELRARVSRVEVALALGVRVALGPTWADGFEPGSAALLGGFIPGGAGSSWVVNGPPSDAAVAEYLAHGVGRGGVESAAANDAAFAEDLASVIKSAIEDRSETSLLARRWLREQEPARPGVLEWNVLLSARLAAASRDARSPAPKSGEVAAVWVRLGVLSPLDAEASLRVTPDEVKLCVYPGQAPIVRVEANAVAATSPTPEGHWEVSLRLRPGGASVPLAVRVVGSDGLEFSERLQLSAEDASNAAL